MLKALIVNPFWDTLGGGERYSATFIQVLLSAGWSVDVLWPKNLSSEINTRFGIDISAVNWSDQMYNPLSTLNYQLLFWLSDGSLPTSLAIKTLIHLQFPFQQISGRKISNNIKSRFYTFVVNSRFTKKFIDTEFGVRSLILYPPVDVTLFTSGRKTKRIVYVGRFSNLTQKKGQETLISAFAKISPRLPGWKLILAGGTTVGSDPKSMEVLHKMASGLPVEIVTNPSLAQIKNLYSTSRIFWSASGFGADENTDPLHVEHFGISLVEAMASGCVPVVTNLGGHKEIVTHGTDGFLWSKTSELTDYTLQLVSNPVLMTQLSQSAAQRSKMFSTERFNEQALALVNSGSAS